LLRSEDGRKREENDMGILLLSEGLLKQSELNPHALALGGSKALLVSILMVERDHEPHGDLLRVAHFIR
jgi:hypothetical protein